MPSHGKLADFPVPRGVVLTLLLVIGLLFLGHVRSYLPWTEDDAYISFRYAEHLSRAEGLVFNLGEKVEGYSNFAWVLLAAGAFRLHLDPVMVAKIFGILGGLVALFFSWQLAVRLWPSSPRGALLAPLFLAATPVLPRHAVSGLETTCYASALAASICLADSRPRSGTRAMLLTCLLLLSLLRPEGIAFAVVILLWRLRRSHDSWPDGDGVVSAARIDLLVLLIMFMIYYVWRWVYFGLPFSNTFYFKMTGGFSALRDGLNYSLDFLRQTGGAALSGFGLALLLVRRPSRLHGLILAVVGGQALLVLLAGGDWMRYYRFYAPVMPLLGALMASGASSLVELASGDQRRQRMARWLIGLVLGAAFVNVYKTERAVARGVMEAVSEGGYLAQSYERVGLWLRANSAPGAVVAISDVGAVGYFSHRRILDMFGLIDTHIARRPGRVHHKSDPDYILSRHPDYVVLVRSDDPKQRDAFLRIPDRQLYESPTFTADYQQIHTVPIPFTAERALIYRSRGRREE